MTNINIEVKYANNPTIKCVIKHASLLCLKKINHFSLELEELQFIVTNYLKPYVMIHPLYYYTNPLGKVIKEHVGDELPACFLNPLKEIEDDESFKKSLEEEKRRYEEIISENEDINEEDVVNLLDLCDIFPEEYNSEIVDFLLSKILEGNPKVSDATYERIFLKFVDMFKGDTVPNYNTSIKDEDFFDKDDEAVVRKRYNSYYMFFNRKYIKPINPLRNMFTASHEFRHIIQDDTRNTSLYDYELFKMDEYLVKVCGRAYELDNYDVLSYEIDADLFASILLYKYANQENIRRILLMKIQTLMKQMNNLRRLDSHNNPISLDIYFDEMVKSQGINPYSLGFTNTYDKSGKRLTPLALYKKMSSEANSEYYMRVIINANYPADELAKIVEELREAVEEDNSNSTLLRIYQLYKEKYNIASGNNKKDKKISVSVLQSPENAIQKVKAKTQ